MFGLPTTDSDGKRIKGEETGAQCVLSGGHLLSRLDIAQLVKNWSSSVPPLSRPFPFSFLVILIFSLWSSPSLIGRSLTQNGLENHATTPPKNVMTEQQATNNMLIELSYESPDCVTMLVEI